MKAVIIAMWVISIQMDQEPRVLMTGESTINFIRNILVKGFCNTRTVLLQTLSSISTILSSHKWTCRMPRYHMSSLQVQNIFRFSSTNSSRDKVRKVRLIHFYWLKEDFSFLCRKCLVLLALKGKFTSLIKTGTQVSWNSPGFLSLLPSLTIALCIIMHY